MDKLPNRAPGAAAMEAYFLELAAVLDGLVSGDDVYTAWFSAEQSDFVRVNRGKVRQPGSVAQRYLEIDWMRGTRHATQLLSLSGHLPEDAAMIAAAVANLAAALPDLDPDPHLLISTDVHSSRSIRGGPLPAAEEIVDAVLAAGEGLDLVGIYAGGPVCRGFANSLGQRNWHEATSFNLQWSLYHRADKAVKSALSGFTWDPDAFAAKMADARSQFAHVAQVPRTLAPGTYRAFLAPAAMEEIVGLLCWGGFSGRALATRQSPPESLAMAGGDLAAADALAALGTGLMVGNLWYLNYSDRPACRMTGMTRFATFWVEDGRIVAPVDVLRFDDTITRVLGENLEALTRETELRMETGTYRERQLGSMRLPGALLRGLTFTL